MRPEPKTTPRLRLSLKTLFIVSLVVAAYFAGRSPFERAAISNAIRVRTSENRNAQTAQYANVWRKIALEYRDDIELSAEHWQWEKRKRELRKNGNNSGFGGSFVHYPNEHLIVPRGKRWHLSLSRELRVAKEQLESLDAKILCIWESAPRIETWNFEENESVPLSPDDHIENWLLVSPEREFFEILPDAFFGNDPDVALIAIPRESENMLAIEEHHHRNKANISIAKIASTTFRFEKLDKSYRAVVEKQVVRPNE